MTEDQRRAIPYVVRAALASVAMALFLLGLKGSRPGIPDRSRCSGRWPTRALDLLASLVTLYGVRLAATPADHDHRFGHGKAEALAALFQVMLITASAAAHRLARNPRRSAPRAPRGMPISASACPMVAILATHACCWSISAASSGAPDRSRSWPTTCTISPTCCSTDR